MRRRPLEHDVLQIGQPRMFSSVLRALAALLALFFHSHLGVGFAPLLSSSSPLLSRTAYCIDRMSTARQNWLQAALGAAAGAAAAALLLRRRLRSNLQASEELDSADDPLRRFRKTEAVIRRRNSRVVVVIERCNESHNCAAQCHFLQSFGLASMA